MIAVDYLAAGTNVALVAAVLTSARADQRKPQLITCTAVILGILWTTARMLGGG